MGRWDTGLTLEENLNLLQQHEHRHRSRKDFAFLLWSQEQRKSVGCVYLLPLVKHHDMARAYGFDEQAALVTFWTRDDAEEPNFSTFLVAALKTWLKHHWQFSGFVIRINENESVSKKALEQNSFEIMFTSKDDAQPTLLFYKDPSL